MKKKNKKKAKTKKAQGADALDVIGRMVGDEPEFWDDVAEEQERLRIAQLVHDARTGAGLTQQQLADMIGSTQPSIARLESTDYDGHSLAMLEKIAKALDMRLEVRFVRGARVAGG